MQHYVIGFTGYNRQNSKSLATKTAKALADKFSTEFKVKQFDFSECSFDAGPEFYITTKNRNIAHSTYAKKWAMSSLSDKALANAVIEI